MIVIVGARCAGSYLAMSLARRGWHVTVVEREEELGDVPSTHFIWPDGRELLRSSGVLNEHSIVSPPTISRAHGSIDGTAFNAPFELHDGSPMPATCIRRHALDQALVSAAQNAGVTYLFGTEASSLRWEEGCVTGLDICGRTDGPRHLPAQLVVGADGRNSFIARAVGATEYHRRVAHHSTHWMYVPNATDSDSLTFEHLGKARALTSPTDGGQRLITIATTERGRLDSERLWEALEPFALIREAAGLAEPTAAPVRLMGPLTTFFRRANGPGWALVGDAGFFKDPCTGRGISDALGQAHRLSQALGSPTSSPPRRIVWALKRDLRESSFAAQAEQIASQRSSDLEVELVKGVLTADDGARQLIGVSAGFQSPASVFSAGRIVSATRSVMSAHGPTKAISDLGAAVRREVRARLLPVEGLWARLDGRWGALGPLVVAGVAGLIAGRGMELDVSSHLERSVADPVLSRPHVMLIAGLWLYVLAGLLSVRVITRKPMASLVPVRAHLAEVRAALPVILFPLGALIGFPVDQGWHSLFGLDLSIWTPSHLLMLAGGVGVWPALAVALDRSIELWPSRLAWLTRMFLGLATLKAFEVVVLDAGIGTALEPALTYPVVLTIAGCMTFSYAARALGHGGPLTVALISVAYSAIAPVATLSSVNRPLLIGFALGLEVALLAARWLPELGVVGRAILATVCGLALESRHTAWIARPDLETDWLVRNALPIALAGLGGVMAGDYLAGAARRTLRSRGKAGWWRGLGLCCVVAALALCYPRPTSLKGESITVTWRGDRKAAVSAPRADLDASDRFGILAFRGNRAIQILPLTSANGGYLTDEPLDLTEPVELLVREQDDRRMAWAEVSPTELRAEGVARATFTDERVATFAMDGSLGAWAAACFGYLLVAFWVGRVGRLWRPADDGPGDAAPNDAPARIARSARVKHRSLATRPRTDQWRTHPLR